MKNNPDLKQWGLTADANGELIIEGIRATELAEEYGTPLHVLNENRLRDTAFSFAAAVKENYKGNASVHYAFKCNHVPAVIETIREAGLNAEVMTDFEYKTALKTGYLPDQIIANGPCKTNNFLEELIRGKIKFIVVDSPEELKRINSISNHYNLKSNIVIRVNPDYTPKGIIKSAASGSRNSVFGIDLRNGEFEHTINNLKLMENVNFCGLHFHIGSGIENAKDYSEVIFKLKDAIDYCHMNNFRVRVLDAGGGYHSGTSRELTTKELFMYHAFNLFPHNRNNIGLSFDKYISAISSAVESIFNEEELPELIFEPGRCIAGSNQFLLIKVHYVKRRDNKTWLVTDGGLGTVTLPLFYEYHDIILCNDVNRKNIQKVTITGPCCFPADVVYRNILMPEVHTGEVLAVMDSGAYFTQLESSFGFPHPAIITVDKNGSKIIRRSETFEEYHKRDLLEINFSL